MADGAFKFEDCLLKHYVRKNAWLPMCKQRLKSLKASFERNGINDVFAISPFAPSER